MRQSQKRKTGRFWLHVQQKTAGLLIGVVREQRIGLLGVSL